MYILHLALVGEHENPVRMHVSGKGQWIHGIIYCFSKKPKYGVLCPANTQGVLLVNQLQPLKTNL